MSASISRRKFFQSATLASASTIGFPALSKSGAQGSSPGTQPRLFVGCCAYSYRDYLKDGRMTMEDFVLKGVELGLHGVDITTYWLKSTEPADLAKLRHFAFKNGMPLSGVAIATTMCQPDPAKREQELAKIKQWVDVTEMLGASHLRVFGGPVPKGATDDQGVQWVIEVMKPACDYSGKKGITLGIEDHGGITSKASNILAILRGVDSPYAGVNLDISNFPEDQYAQIEACIPYATHSHIRDFFSHAREPIDLERVWQMFARGGYKGYMSVEYEGKEDAMTGVPKLIETIKALCKKYSTA